jgi:hydrogenase small subunit
MKISSQISRRTFLQWITFSTAGFTLSQAGIPRLIKTLQAQISDSSILWIQASGDLGCSCSVLNSVYPSIKEVLLGKIVSTHQLTLNFHPTLMASSGDKAVKILEDSFKSQDKEHILIVEGAISVKDDGSFCIIGENKDQYLSALDVIIKLAKNAKVVIALGTCASYGGISSILPDSGMCIGVSLLLKQKGIKTSVINVPGCPVHPDWFIGTLASILLYGLPKKREVDEKGRLKLFFGKSIHDQCHRRGDFNAGRYALSYGEEGCLLKLGCKGPITFGDCPKRLWNGGTNWCVGAGKECTGCTEPNFPEKEKIILRT